MFFNRFNRLGMIHAVLCMTADTGATEALPEAPADTPSPTMEAAPGSEKPEGAADTGRIVYPQLAACGGKFRCTPTPEDATVHFDKTLLPSVGPWPLSKDQDGKDIPLPWTDHSRIKHFALTKECFDSEVGYFYYRMWEAHSKFQDAHQDYVDAVNGVDKAKVSKDKQAAQLAKGLEAMSAELQAAMPGLDIAALLAVIKARQTGATVPAAEAPTTTA